MSDQRSGPALRVGLTGGIASGKSTVSAELSRLGANVIDYDLKAREAVALGSPGLAAIIERFGRDILLSDGTLDRPALGALVFTDELARRDLEAITHPAIRELVAAAENAAPADAIVVHDNPLLVEMGGHALCDVVIVVDAAVEHQVERMLRDRALSETEARDRIAAQASREARLEAADVVIDNNGSLEELLARVGEVWTELQA